MSFDPLIAECKKPRFDIGFAIEWLAIRIISALVMGMFVTVGMALASG